MSATEQAHLNLPSCRAAASQPEKLVILGLTGSVGNSALRVLREFPGRFSLAGFSYHSNFELARSLQQEFSVKQICCSNPSPAWEELAYWHSQGVSLCTDLEQLLAIDYHTVLTAVVGAAGVKATWLAVQQGKKILLANKETLVMAGEFIMPLARQNKACIVPVDSEHSSVFRLLEGKKNFTENSRLILTASGGSLRQLPLGNFATVSREQVLNHPTWSMGSKITVDSASMINKALEIIEAHHLFGFDYDRLSAVIHPASYVHAIVQEPDGSFVFHVSAPDMVYPVAYSLFYPAAAPEILHTSQSSQEKLTRAPAIEFLPIDQQRYPGYFLGLEAGQKGGAYPAVFNAANEVAVQNFLENRIRFVQIPVLIAAALQQSPYREKPSGLSDLFEADAWARDFVNGQVEKQSKK